MQVDIKASVRITYARVTLADADGTRCTGANAGPPQVGENAFFGMVWGEMYDGRWEFRDGTACGVKPWTLKVDAGGSLTRIDAQGKHTYDQVFSEETFIIN